MELFFSFVAYEAARTRHTITERLRRVMELRVVAVLTPIESPGSFGERHPTVLVQDPLVAALASSV